MRFSVMYPIAKLGYGEEFLVPANVTRFAQAAEAAGFSSLAFTEHPAPSRKWLDAGGHESIDPFAGLSFCAAVTTTIELMTFLLVLPYRNPFLAAKSIASVDILSSGRLVLGLGTGYLRSEFAALGVSFDERNHLFDEALETLTHLWTEGSTTRSGLHFEAIDQVSLPAPLQHPHPPLWFGGNSRRTLERVARWGAGWCPMQGPELLATSTGTATVATDDDLRVRIELLRELVSDAGRDPSSIEVQLLCPEREALGIGGDQSAHTEHLLELERLGVTRFVLDPPATGIEPALEALQAYGEAVIAAVP